MRLLVKFITCFFSLQSITYAAIAQDLSIKDPATGKYLAAQQYADYKGTPFVKDEWFSGEVVTATGTFSKVQLKLNLYNNTLCLNKDGEPFEIQNEIKSVTLMPVQSDTSTYMYFIKGLVANGLTSKQFVQKLEGGKYNLYKVNSKVVREFNEINVGIVRSFADVIKYYLSGTSGTKEVKLDKKELLEMLSDKQSELKDFIAKEKFSFRNEKDLISLIKYYNKL